MQRFQSIPRWVIVLAIFLLCICCMEFLKKCLKIEKFSNQESAKVTVTNYWANWCYHSNNFTEEWNKFKNALNADTTKAAFAQDYDCGLSVENVTDAEKAVNQPIVNKCNESGVGAYPTVLITYTKDGEKIKQNYDGGRTKAELDAKVNEILALEGLE